MADPPRTVDGCEAILKAQGWSPGDMSYLDGSRQIWAVFCRRGQETVFGYADTQLAAWQQAVGRVLSASLYECPC